MTITTKPCPLCEGLGRVPEDPDVSQADLRAETRERITSSPGYAAFNERVARKQAEMTGRDGT